MAEFSYTLSEDRPKQIGLIALQADETIERDFRRLIPSEVDLLVTRVASDERVTSATLAAMEARLTAAAGLFPRSARFEAVGYGCTSGAAEIGMDRIAELVRVGTVTDAVTEPVSALLAACRARGVARLALLSPYIAPVSERLRGVLASRGVATPVFGSFAEAEEARVARIDGASIRAAALELMRGAAVDGLFLSCTNLRTLDVLGGLERELGVPVLSSNPVLAWHLLKLANASPPPGLGTRLWTEAN